MKRVLAGALTAIVIGLLLWSGPRRPVARREPREAPRPDATHPAEARINALLSSAGSGDVEGYLGSFGGPIGRRLEREVSERGRDAFADELRRAARSRKSHAVFAVEPDGERTARMTVETVYPDRNERQTYRLDDGPGGWLVTDVETVRSLQPKGRYGAPATFREPEGPPVQSGALTVETGDDAPGGAAGP